MMWCDKKCSIFSLNLSSFYTCFHHSICTKCFLVWLWGEENWPLLSTMPWCMRCQMNSDWIQNNTSMSCSMMVLMDVTRKPDNLSTMTNFALLEAPRLNCEICLWQMDLTTSSMQITENTENTSCCISVPLRAPLLSQPVQVITES